MKGAYSHIEAELVLNGPQMVDDFQSQNYLIHYLFTNHLIK